MASFVEVFAQLLEGFGQSMLIFLITLVLSLPLGLVICFGSMSKVGIISKITKTLVWAIRGTPLMLQILIIFYAPGLLFKMQGFDRFASVIVAFGINYAAYFSEIYRGGIESIPTGQYEAGEVLGLTKRQTFLHIIMPQVYKRILPPMGNEFMTLVKDTSLARIIVVEELLFVAGEFLPQGLIWPLFFTGVFYLVMCGVLTLLFSYLEKRNNRWA